MEQFAGIPEWDLLMESIRPIEVIEQCPCAQQPAEAQQLDAPRRMVSQLKEGSPASEKETSKIQA